MERRIFIVRNKISMIPKCEIFRTVKDVTNDLLSIKVYDYDMIGSNDLLGEVELPVGNF